MQAFQQGEEHAFDFIFRNFYPALCKFACTYLKDPEEARDLVQDCFIKLWERHKKLHNPSAIKSFLYTTVRNRCIDVLRKRKSTPVTFQELTHLYPAWEVEEINELIYSETMRHIHVAISNLPAKMQQVFRLYFLEGKKLEEIADTLHITPRTARNHKNRAITILRGILTGSFILLFFFVV